VPDVARELGIRAEMLRQWIRQAAGQPGRPARDVFPGNGKLSSQDEELRRLRREVARLTEERDILKKAAAFFARESR
jgi:transposase